MKAASGGKPDATATRGKGRSMEILVNAANLLYVVAYFTTDMLRLRILTVTAAVCLATYFASQPVPLLNVVAWNGFFIALNVFQIVRILMRRRRQDSPISHRFGGLPTRPTGALDA